MVGTATEAGAVASTRAASGERVVDAVLIGLVACAARLPAYVASRHLHFDDGVYGASAVAMRGGGRPFEEVFSSQGPLHLPLVWLGDLLGGRTSFAPRTASLVGGVAAAVLTYVIGRRTSGRPGAVIAALVVALSGSVLWTTGPITADGPALALVLAALLLALHDRDRPGARTALLAGAVLGAALAVKAPLVLLASIPVAGSLLAAGGLAHLALGAGGAAAVGLAATLPWGLARVWDQSVSYQLDSERNASFAGNAGKVFSTLYDRDLLLLVVATAALVTLLVTAVRRERSPASCPSHGDPCLTRLIAWWLGALLLFLVLEPALWRNHLAHLIAPAALLATSAFAAPSRFSRVVVVVVAAAVPFHLISNGDILRPDPYPPAAAGAVAALRSLPDDALAISDEPGLVWRAGRQTPRDFVDTSIKRIQQGRITVDDVVSAAAEPRVCAVLVWATSRFGSFDDLPARLEHDGYELAMTFPRDRALYTRPCAPPTR